MKRLSDNSWSRVSAGVLMRKKYEVKYVKKKTKE